MPVNERGEALRARLREKTTEELERLLAEDFAKENQEGDAEYAVALMEVIGEREQEKISQTAKKKSWEALQKRILAEEKKRAGASAGPKPVSASESGPREAGDKPWYIFQKNPYMLRGCAAILILVVILGGTACAKSLGVFQALAEWTAERFGFVSVQDDGAAASEKDPIRKLRLAVADHTDTPGVPTWSPKGTEESGNINTIEYSDRVVIRGDYATETGEFTIRIVIYNEPPEDYTGVYQKDEADTDPYWVDGVAHYIMDNNGCGNAAWTNGCLEGCIQGDLTIATLQEMINSIYTE